jgi:hypothetical protein
MAKIFNQSLQNTLKLPNRNCWIEIQQENKDNSYNETVKVYSKLDGLDIKFSITSTGQSFPRAKISICNLSQENIDWLINYFEVPQPQAYLNKIIKLYVGYNDTATCIFRGTVFNTSLTSPPDMWFEFEAIFRYDIVSRNIKISLSNEVTIKQVYEFVAKSLNLSLDWQASSEKKLASFVFDGSGNKCLEEVLGIDNTVSYYIDNKYSGDSNGVLRCFDIPTANKNNDSIKFPNWTKEISLSARTGLFGVPKFSPFGCEVTCILNTDINYLDILNLESIYQKRANGKYKIYNITHTGESRGNDFKTIIKATVLYGRDNDSYVRQTPSEK